MYYYEKRQSVKKRALFLVFAMLVLIVASSINIVIAQTKDVVIDNNGEILEIKTMKVTVGAILEEQSIIVSEHDFLEPSLEENILKGDKIVIKKSIPINVKVGEQVISVKTYYKNVKEALENSEELQKEGLYFDDNDLINYDRLDPIKRHMNIEVKKIDSEVVEEEVEIAFKEEIIYSSNLEKGKTKTVQDGANGIKLLSYSVIKTNGEVTEKSLMSENIIVAPKNRIVEKGTKVVFANTSSNSQSYSTNLQEAIKTSSGQTLNAKKVLNMRATAYDLSYESCGKNPGDRGYGITATGRRAERGVVAVDPKVIPLNSKLYIETSDGSWAYGYAVAADTGGAIKGNKIDLFFESNAAAKKFGVKNVKVYLLN